MLAKFLFGNIDNNISAGKEYIYTVERKLKKQIPSPDEE